MDLLSVLARLQIAGLNPVRGENVEFFVKPFVEKSRINQLGNYRTYGINRQVYSLTCDISLHFTPVNVIALPINRCEQVDKNPEAFDAEFRL